MYTNTTPAIWLNKTAFIRHRLHESLYHTFIFAEEKIVFFFFFLFFFYLCLKPSTFHFFRILYLFVVASKYLTKLISHHPLFKIPIEIYVFVYSFDRAKALDLDIEHCFMAMPSFCAIKTVTW